jgi:hypothetical protein
LVDEEVRLEPAVAMMTGLKAKMTRARLHQIDQAIRRSIVRSRRFGPTDA